MGGRLQRRVARTHQNQCHNPLAQCKREHHRRHTHGNRHIAPRGHNPGACHHQRGTERGRHYRQHRYSGIYSRRRHKERGNQCRRDVERHDIRGFLAHRHPHKRHRRQGKPWNHRTCQQLDSRTQCLCLCEDRHRAETRHPRVAGRNLIQRCRRT